MIKFILDLPIETRFIIARANENIWYSFWQYDPQFNAQARTKSRRDEYVELFTEKIIKSDKMSYKLFNKYHRENDLPSVVYTDNATMAKMWHYNGLLHRDNDLPAIIFKDGLMQWYKYGECHREGNKPAIVYPDGHEEEWINGKFIRVLRYHKYI